MTILGIDPGVTSTGYGVIRLTDGDSMLLLDYGVIKTSPKDKHEVRLKKIYKGITEIIKNHKPDEAAIETVFYSKNLKSLVQVSEAIGVISLALCNFGLNIKRFTPLEVKQGIVGFGQAKKEQIQLMVMNILNLKNPPKPDHASDALAVALCYRNLCC